MSGRLAALVSSYLGSEHNQWETWPSGGNEGVEVRPVSEFLNPDQNFSIWVGVFSDDMWRRVHG